MLNNSETEDSALFLSDHTPLERYCVQGREAWVKRDDLFARWPAPPLGKLRGALAVLDKLYGQGVRIVGCWDTRISALGQGIAACALRFPGMRVVTAYPASQGSSVPEPLRVAEHLGAEVLPVRAGRITISFAAARRAVEERGGLMLPFGLDCAESVQAIGSEAASVPSEAVDGGTVVVSCGSGVTLAGLIHGLGTRASAFVGVSSGRSVITIERCLRRHGSALDRVTVMPAQVGYMKQSENPIPFPSHPNYDRKAWVFLEKNIARMRAPVLFWNVGAVGTGTPTDFILRAREEMSGSVGYSGGASGLSKLLSATGAGRDSPTMH